MSSFRIEGLQSLSHTSPQPFYLERKVVIDFLSVGGAVVAARTVAVVRKAAEEPSEVPVASGCNLAA